VPEKTEHGQQIVVPGTERSALQAAKERAKRCGRKKGQADPGSLFETRERRQLSLNFDSGSTR
jgi:hypothetical protein